MKPSLRVAEIARNLRREDDMDPVDSYLLAIIQVLDELHSAKEVSGDK